MSLAEIEWLSPELPFIRVSPPNPTVRMLLAHGAGIPMDHVFMETLTQVLVAEGVEVIRFEFPYMARRRLTQKKSFPDRTEVLLACWHRVFRYFYTNNLPYVVAGKSLGGRMASLFALEQAQARWVVCFGYPFHPVSNTLKLRIEHLASIPGSTLIIQGTRDSFGSRVEVQGYDLGGVNVSWLETCDHDFKPLCKSGLTVNSVMQDAAHRAVEFIHHSAEDNSFS